jgi:hypothetical protein
MIFDDLEENEFFHKQEAALCFSFKIFTFGF